MTNITNLRSQNLSEFIRLLQEVQQEVGDLPITIFQATPGLKYLHRSFIGLKVMHLTPKEKEEVEEVVICFICATHEDNEIVRQEFPYARDESSFIREETNDNN